MISDIEGYRLKKKYAIALRRILTDHTPSKNFTRYLGLSARACRAFITLQLKPPFTIGNYGRMWVIDHIVPLFLFDQKKETDLFICWNYLNIIPMPLALNRLKGISLEFALQELELRRTWNTASPVLKQLELRLKNFVASMHEHHSAVEPHALHKVLNLDAH